MKTKERPMIRLNTRIKPEQHQFIKDQALKNHCTEGEMLRTIVEFYMVNKK
jgi:hypothetical protein